VDQIARSKLLTTQEHVPILWNRVLLVAVLALAAIVLCGKGVSNTPVIGARITYPFQLDDAEGVVLAEAQLIAAGVNPYAYQPSPAPYFYAGPYPPVYTLINTAAIATIGPTFKVGRAVQLLATFGVVVWLMWGIGWSKWRSDNRASLAGVWAALLWGTAHLVVTWSTLVRPDMMALMWNLLGVVVLRRWWEVSRNEDEGKRDQDVWPRGLMLVTLALGALCFALGWWTKQTFVAVPAAFLVTTFLTRPRIAITLAALYAGMIVVPFGALTALTGGGFAQKVVGYQGSWEWGAFRRLAEPFVLRYGLWLALAALIALVACARQRQVSFSIVWLLFAGVAALGAGTSGGNHNHFVELLAAATLIIGQDAENVLRSSAVSTAPTSRVRFAVARIVGMVIVLTGIACIEREGRHGWLADVYRAPTISERDGTAAVAAYLANARTPVYSDNVGILVIARQPVRVTDPFTMAAEVRLGRWDDSALVADVAAGRYSVIAIREDHFDPEHPPSDMTPALVRAIQARYRLAERNVLYLYVPK